MSLYFFSKGDKINVIKTNNNAMHRTHLISHWLIMDKRGDVFQKMKKQSFDSHQTIILETSPDISPTHNDNGNIRECPVENISADHLIIRGKLLQPDILINNGCTQQRLKGQSTS
jgi:hypothetical protein